MLFPEGLYRHFAVVVMQRADAFFVKVAAISTH